MHFSTDFLISNRWTEDLFEVQAIMYFVGWKIILVIRALPDPLLSSCKSTPSSALKILIIVPLVDALAIRVPSAFTARAPTSDSWAWTTLSIDLSTTYVKTFSEPRSVCRHTIVFYTGFSAVLIEQRPKMFGQVSTCSINFSVSKLKTNTLSSSTTTNISFLSRMFLISLPALNVISVRFFFSWSSQMTTLFFCDARTNTMILVLYIISISDTLSFSTWLFFLSLCDEESFYTISKPILVATAKYSWVWLQAMWLIGWSAARLKRAFTSALSTEPFLVFLTSLKSSALILEGAPEIEPWDLALMSNCSGARDFYY